MNCLTPAQTWLQKILEKKVKACLFTRLKIEVHQHAYTEVSTTEAFTSNIWVLFVSSNFMTR